MRTTLALTAFLVSIATAVHLFNIRQRVERWAQIAETFAKSANAAAQTATREAESAGRSFQAAKQSAGQCHRAAIESNRFRDGLELLLDRVADVNRLLAAFPARSTVNPNEVTNDA